MIKESKIFKKNGEFRLVTKVTDMIDTILFIIGNNDKITTNLVNLELRKCGYIISNPTLKKIIRKLNQEKLVSMEITKHLI